MAERSIPGQDCPPGSASNPSQPLATAPKSHRRWVVAVCLLLVASAFHAPLLRLSVSPLVARDQPRRADYLFIHSGDGRFGRAAEAYRGGEAKQILVLERQPTRLVRLGILPSRADECRRELARRGVPEDAIVVIPGAANTPWQMARCLGMWLRDHP